jgi:hypothetical protein
MASVEISPALYQRLKRVAQLTQQPVDELVRRTLEAGVPPLPEDLPEAMHADLLALESLNDDELWQVAQSRLSDEDIARRDDLLERNSAGTITAAERQALAKLRQAADGLMLRKAYATVLLKWRGHRLPPLVEADDGE